MYYNAGETQRKRLLALSLFTLSRQLLLIFIHINVGCCCAISVNAITYSPFDTVVFTTNSNIKTITKSYFFHNYHINCFD